MITKDNIQVYKYTQAEYDEEDMFETILNIRGTGVKNTKRMLLLEIYSDDKDEYLHVAIGVDALRKMIADADDY